MRICRAFLMKNANEALRHINTHTKTVKKYGSKAYGHYLHVWDDGERRLLYCETCKAYILAQWSEYHSFTDSPDGYYDDYFPVVGETDAEYLNQLFSGDAIEQEYPGCMLKRTNSAKDWDYFGKFVEYKSANKQDFVSYKKTDLEVPDPVHEPTDEELRVKKEIEEHIAQAHRNAFITQKVKTYCQRFVDNEDMRVNPLALYHGLLRDAFKNAPVCTFEVKDERGTILRKAYPCEGLILFVQYELGNFAFDNFQLGTAFMMLIDGDENFIRALNAVYNTYTFVTSARDYFAFNTLYMKLPKSDTYTLEDIATFFEKHKKDVTERYPSD